MRASELRIGNYVCWDFDQEVYTVSEIFDAEDYVVSTVKNEKELFQGRPDQLRPLKLDEELLVRLNFKKRIAKESIRDYSDYRNGNMVCNITRNGIEIEYCSAWQPIDERTHITTIQHVHQLQNLYFTLTGCELKFSK